MGKTCKISAGLLIKTPSGYLLEHPTGFQMCKGNYDIPKGLIDEQDAIFIQDGQLMHDEDAVIKALGTFRNCAGACPCTEEYVLLLLKNALRELKEETGLTYSYIAGGFSYFDDALHADFSHIPERECILPILATGKYDFKYMGVHKYRSDKYLAIFYTEITKDIDVTRLHCDSFFNPTESTETKGYSWKNWQGGPVPEINGYRISTDIDWMFSRLQEIVKNMLSVNNTVIDGGQLQA